MKIDAIGMLKYADGVHTGHHSRHPRSSSHTTMSYYAASTANEAVMIQKVSLKLINYNYIILTGNGGNN